MKLLPLCKTYDGTTVLSFPGYTLEKGSICAVVGANGSGKSTFSKLLAGVIPADGGGTCLECGTVGYLPQKPYAFRRKTEANILLGSRDRARAEQLMDALQIRHLAGKRADRLSGGETARMALARLMMQTYDLVLLDEPTAAMDMESTVLAEQLIRDYVRQTGCALILITHSLQQARRMADHAMFFRQGRLVESGPADRVLYDPAQQETRAFLEFYGQ